jgi:hypothetical protein
MTMKRTKTGEGGETLADKLRLKFLWSIRTELAVAVLIGALFLGLPALLRWFDPTAGALGVAYLHFLVPGALAVSVALLLFWVLVNVGLRPMDRWFDGDREGESDNAKDRAAGKSFWKDFFEASPAVRLGVFLGVFAIMMFTFAIALHAFLQSG